MSTIRVSLKASNPFFAGYGTVWLLANRAGRHQSLPVCSLSILLNSWYPFVISDCGPIIVQQDLHMHQLDRSAIWPCSWLLYSVRLSPLHYCQQTLEPHETSAQQIFWLVGAMLLRLLYQKGFFDSDGVPTRHRRGHHRHAHRHRHHATSPPRPRQARRAAAWRRAQGPPWWLQDARSADQWIRGLKIFVCLYLNQIDNACTSTQSFEVTHICRMYIHVFIWVNDHTCMNIYIFTVFLKKRMA
jgi:hypothetical protein